jgi:hypothetical protein
VCLEHYRRAGEALPVNDVGTHART